MANDDTAVVRRVRRGITTFPLSSELIDSGDEARTTDLCFSGRFRGLPFNFGAKQKRGRENLCKAQVRQQSSHTEMITIEIVIQQRNVIKCVTTKEYVHSVISL